MLKAPGSRVVPADARSSHILVSGEIAEVWNTAGPPASCKAKGWLQTRNLNTTGEDISVSPAPRRAPGEGARKRDVGMVSRHTGYTHIA